MPCKPDAGWLFPSATWQQQVDMGSSPLRSYLENSGVPHKYWRLVTQQLIHFSQQAAKGPWLGQPGSSSWPISFCFARGKTIGNGAAQPETSRFGSSAGIARSPLERAGTSPGEDRFRSNTVTQAESKGAIKSSKRMAGDSCGLREISGKSLPSNSVLRFDFASCG